MRYWFDILSSKSNIICVVSIKFEQLDGVIHTWYVCRRIRGTQFLLILFLVFWANDILFSYALKALFSLGLSFWTEFRLRIWAWVSKQKWDHLRVRMLLTSVRIQVRLHNNSKSPIRPKNNGTFHEIMYNKLMPWS